MQIIEKPLVRIVKMILYSSNKTMDDLTKELGLSKQTLTRRGARTKAIFTFSEIAKICKCCGYRIYIEKPDIKLDVTDWLEECTEAEGESNDE